MQKLPLYHLKDFEFYNRSFYVNELSAHIRKHRFIDRPHKHDFYLVVLFTQGSGTHEIDFTTYPVSKGSLFVMSPGQVHRWSLSDDAEGYIFFHTAEVYNLTYSNRQIEDFSFFSAAPHQPLLKLTEAQLKLFEPTFTRIWNEYRTNDTHLKFQTLVALIDLLYLDMTKLYVPEHAFSKEGSPVYLQKLNEFRKLIAIHYLHLKSPKDYAELMNVSVKHLNRICQETVQMTSSEMISSRLILEAKRMLIHSGKSVKEIAEAIGFEDVSYFVRFFRKHTGQTPLSFQKNYN